MAHIQSCTACGRKVACLACSRRNKTGTKVVKRKVAPKVEPKPDCEFCDEPHGTCECGGYSDDEEDDEEEEPDGFGGGGDVWGMLAASFISDDDEDPLALPFENEKESDTVEEWTQRKPKKPKQAVQRQSAPSFAGYMPAVVATTKPRAKKSDPSGLGAGFIKITSPIWQQFKRFSPSKKKTDGTLDFSNSIGSSPPRVTSFYDWAKSIGTITQRWDNPVTYIPGRKIHGGTDIAKLPIGQPITAYRGGTVIEVSGNSTMTTGWGLTVVIVDEYGNKHRYAHLLESFVRKNSRVNQGDVIGAMGKSGNVFGKTGIHLHYEIKDKFGTLLNPETV
jgi:murein DD-endopeptidase MepM/ murein hydrolase activator NlpD